MEVRVPAMGESVSEANLMTLSKKVGDHVEADETIAILETDKINMEVYSPVAGILTQWLLAEGATVKTGDIIAVVEEGAASVPTTSQTQAITNAPEKTAAAQKVATAPTPAPVTPNLSSPAASKMIKEGKIDAHAIKGTGKDGMVTKSDIIKSSDTTAETKQPTTATSTVAPSGQVANLQLGQSGSDNRTEMRVKMSKLRQRVAERLKYSQNTAAMLTTFNEVDMTNVIGARNRHKDAFEKKHGIKLGFMSFFVKASVSALLEMPSVNASIDGNEIIYRKYCDIGVAISSEQGLVVPILRNAEKMTFVDIERAILEYSKKARSGSLAMGDITGGTFTVSNGGVFGSLLSTPIINPPQTAILGMHKTQERPVALDGQIVIRPMMYLALSYDHRLIDGKEAVSFLIHIKQRIEDPAALLLDM